MTDTTELALLFSKAKASVFTLEYISQFEPADIDSDDVDLRFEVDGRDTGTNVSIVDECGQAARVIGALVEALEKARQRITQMESRTVTDWIEHDGKWRPESLGLDELVYLKTRKQELKIPYPAGKVKGWMNTGGDMDVMAYKLASPQASTVTVKLPLPRRKTADDYVDDTFEPCDLAAVYNACRLECEVKFKNALTAAGIKVEAE